MNMVSESGLPLVLVADDDATIREVLREVLEGVGYAVAEAADGLQAVDEALADPPAIVLVDLMMPGLSGAEVTAALKADPRTATVPVLAMSAGRLSASAAGIAADGFIGKPFDFTELISALAYHAGPPEQGG